MPRRSKKYESLAEFYAARHELPSPLILGQIEQESDFDPRAVSSADARGLLQLMPATAEETWYRLYPQIPWHPELIWNEAINLDLGCYYLHRAIERGWPEIPDWDERGKFGLAAYNGGQGYVIRAAQLARLEEGQPESYRDWRDAGSPRGAWMEWALTQEFLEEAVVRGKLPDSDQIRDYVDRIEGRARTYGGDPWRA